MTHPFWREQCSGRGPGLSHAHFIECPDDHAAEQCCHCEFFPPMTEAQLDARLGAWGPTASPLQPPVPQVRPVEDVLALAEPQMRFPDSMPTGPAWGRGRSWDNHGGLNMRDKARLEFVIFNERITGYR